MVITIVGVEMKKVVIVDAGRTPIGSFLGTLSSLKATELGKIVISSILNKTKINKEIVNEVIMGNVLTAGLGQAPARQAALTAGLPNHVECLTINKMCGSGLKAVMLAHQAILTGDAEVIIAGGMESMSNAPHLLMNSRTGYRLGNKKIVDSIIIDGLWDVYNDIHMGSCAESCARNFHFTRKQVDDFAVESYNKAINAQKNGLFNEEIVPVTVKRKKEEILITEDEEPNFNNRR